MKKTWITDQEVVELQEKNHFDPSAEYSTEINHVKL